MVLCHFILFMDCKWCHRGDTARKFGIPSDTRRNQIPLQVDTWHLVLQLLTWPFSTLHGTSRQHLMLSVATWHSRHSRCGEQCHTQFRCSVAQCISLFYIFFCFLIYIPFFYDNGKDAITNTSSKIAVSNNSNRNDNDGINIILLHLLLQLQLLTPPPLVVPIDGK